VDNLKHLNRIKKFMYEQHGKNRTASIQPVKWKPEHQTMFLMGEQSVTEGESIDLGRKKEGTREEYIEEEYYEDQGESEENLRATQNVVSTQKMTDGGPDKPAKTGFDVLYCNGQIIEDDENSELSYVINQGEPTPQAKRPMTAFPMKTSSRPFSAFPKKG
jgi:hypothetical protein